MTDLLLPMLSAFIVALVMTGLVRRYASARRLVDVPNARSSHQLSTPRGGGLAIVVGFACILVVQAVGGRADTQLLIAVLPAVLGVAAIGFMDDHQHVAARVRIAVHVVAIAWALYWIGGPLAIPWPSGVLSIGWPVKLFAMLAMVWFLNLFNFMDGIDGIAASEAIFIACSGAWLAATSGQIEVASALLILAAAVLGFLAWNWPPAKIFMGDVGSGFLGAALGILGYAAAFADNLTLWSWVILVAVFVADATTTLIRRVLRRDRWYEAHRSHAYQRAARRWGHLRVTVAVVLINLLWLLPMALLALAAPSSGVFIALLAYMPLLGLAAWLGAGTAENRE